MPKKYIELEAAIELFEQAFDNNWEVSGTLDRLRAIPAADVAPVRRGRWIKDGEDGPVYCSECGEEHEWGDYRATYCDTCGAKMNGGQDDGV